jgi:FkbM family methyltransferase
MEMPKSSFAQFRKHIFLFISLWRMVGTLSTLQWFTTRWGEKLRAREPESCSLRPHLAQHPLMARLRGSSDISVFNQIFIHEEYRTLRQLEDVSLVLDLGANVGYSSAYFLSSFPKCRVVAVEPDERNIAVCRFNLKPYGDRVVLLHGAVWSECTGLSLSLGSGVGREWATRVTQPSDPNAGDVPAWNVSSLIDMADVVEVDLLKVDIEGAERAVFSNCRSWLPRVRNICIELHGKVCRETFFHALADFEYSLEYSGELTICKNIRPKP